MALIQIFLLVMSFAVLFYFSRFRSRALDRLAVTLISMIAVVMILFPTWTTHLANLLGVGRGTDLLVYLGFVAAAFLSVLFYAKSRDTEERLTEVARAVALLQVRMPTLATDTQQTTHCPEGTDSAVGNQEDQRA